MFQNYFKIALRMLWKRKAFTFLNATGLALGIAAFMLMLQYISFEWEVNKFHTQAPHIYRALLSSSDGWIAENVPPTIGPLGKENFPEIKAFARVPNFAGEAVVTYAGNDTAAGKVLLSFREKNWLYADHAFFKMFSFPMMEGSGSLEAPNTMVISRLQARKYFGEEKALGKVLTLHNQFGDISYTITGIFEEVPAQSDLQFNMVFSLQIFANPANLNNNGWASLDNWGTPAYSTFFLLHPDANAAALENKFLQLKIKLFPDGKEVIRLQPLPYVHLSESLTDPYPTTGNLLLVEFLLAIAVIILLIAWINYINLSTVFALNRAKEVGIRKVIGAARAQLISQYLLESLILNFFSLVVAFFIVQVLQAPFNEFTGKPLSLSLLNQGWIWAGGMAILITGTLASGGYVAWVLSAFHPIQTLKGAFARSGRGVFLRKSLVVMQFVISTAFVVCTFALYRQLHFMQNQDLGMNIEQLLIINGPSINTADKRQKGIAFGNEVVQLPFVHAYASSGNVPGSGYNFGTNGITRLSPAPGDEEKSYSMMIIDDKFLDTYQIPLVAGKNFTPLICEKAWYKMPVVMLNESAARQLGFASAAEAVGQEIKWGAAYEVIGVVRDYHHQSLKQKIDPVIFLADYNPVSFTIRLQGKGMQEQIAALQQLYHSLFPNNPFEYYFADEVYDRQYRNEQKFSQVFTASSALAVIIACLGLFGLAAFSAEQRTKEIGIRKVLGASVLNIIGLLSREFLKLIGIAFVIALPLAWYAINRGLENFAYQIAFPWWLFLLTGVLTALIALITISWQSIKAALANPVKSLRNE